MGVETFVPILDGTAGGSVHCPVSQVIQRVLNNRHDIATEAYMLTVASDGVTLVQSCNVPPLVPLAEPSAPTVNVSDNLGVTEDNWLKGLDAEVEANNTMHPPIRQQL